MKTNNNLIQKITNFILDRKLSKLSRNKMVRNLDNSTTALILTDYLNSKDKEIVKDFIRFLRNLEIDVLEVSYYNKKNSPEVSDFKDQLILTSKDFNMLGFAKSSSIDIFLSRPFNLLIDLSMVKYPQITGIVAISKADFKIGLVPVPQKYYDFMIDLGKDRNMKKYIDQVIHYLRILKS